MVYHHKSTFHNEKEQKERVEPGQPVRKLLEGIGWGSDSEQLKKDFFLNFLISRKKLAFLPVYP